ncbi:hypothetical protein NQ315_005767 [Exocentrus adspersus]|uniref:Uncharacterized protein n=1 Tax=Exocentrus adspersus TaxID=1586481 RepID=A0AAV8V7H6_9CUCU|nr:hypothetical protein NQ315_005767 [Exocentrus adspersus]
MSSPQSGNEVETLGPNLEKIYVDGSIPALDMDTEVKTIDTDFRLTSSEETHGLPRDRTKKPLANEMGRLDHLLLPHSISHYPVSPFLPGSATFARPNQVTNKHTLEIQFINKKKRLSQLKKDLLEKQKPVLDLYQNLVQIKRRLEELGKAVQLDEIKLLPYNDKPGKEPEQTEGGAGETISPEVVISMQTSIEEIPKTLMDICKNLLARRAVIVELLESVTKSEVDVGDLSDKIETYKNNLDAIINEHEKKIKELVINWQALLNDKRCMNTNVKISDLEEKLKAQEKLTQESNQMLLDLQKKLDERRANSEKVQADLNIYIQNLKSQILRFAEK